MELARALAACGLLVFCSPAAAQSWQGGSGNLWSAPTNWFGGVAPASSNTTAIAFTNAALSFTPVADVALTLNRMDVTGATFYTLTGSMLTFAGSTPVIFAADAGHTMANDIAFPGGLEIQAAGLFRISGTLTGGPLTKTGAAGLWLLGDWLPSGTTTIADGFLRVAVPGPLTLSDVVNNGGLMSNVPAGLLITGSFTGTGSLTVEGGLLGHIGPPLAHAGATTVATGAQLDASIAGNNSPLVVDGTFNTGGSTVGSLAGSNFAAITINAGTLTVGGNHADTFYMGSITGPGALAKMGSGRLDLLGANTLNGGVVISGGVLLLGHAFGGAGSVAAIQNNAALETSMLGGLMITGAVTGTGSIAVLGGMTAQGGPDFTHLGTTSVSAGARLDATIINNASLTVDGVMNTGVTTVGSLAGAASGQLFVNGASLTVGGNDMDSEYAGQLIGTGTLFKQGAGRLTLSGNSMLGIPLVVDGGILRVGNGTVGPGMVASVVNNTAFEGATNGLLINGPFTGPGTLNVVSGFMGSTSGLTHTGFTTINAGTQLGASITNNALLTIDGQFDTAFSSVGALAGAATGQLNINGGTMTVGANNANTIYAGNILNNGGLTKTGTGRLTLTGTTTVGIMTVDAGTLLLDGSHLHQVNVSPAGTLGGNGTIGFVASGAGTIAPGTAGPGLLTIGDLFSGATFAFEILGATPGVQHDQIRITTQVTLGGPLVLSGGFVPPAGTALTLFANDGPGPVMGTFPGLPEGATLVFNGVTMRISYVGGSGNDIVLSHAAYTVTPSVSSGNGTITPSTPQSVAHGTTRVFTLAPSPGYTGSVGGTCPPGTLVGNAYTTGVIVADCTVVATFALNTYVVTSSSGANGSIAPAGTQSVAHGGTAAFTVTPTAGHTASMGGTCPAGSLVGTAYTTGPIVAACTVVAAFTNTAVTSFTGPTATGTGNATASFTGGGPTCTFVNPQFIPVTGHARSPPAGSAPAVQFPHGLFDFTLQNCAPGSTITMTIAYPAALAAGSQYWKYGPEPANAAPHWYIMPATVGAATMVFSIRDGSQGDDDLAANGTLVDQGGPGVPPAGGGPIQTPTMSEWMLLLMALSLLAFGMRRLRTPGG